MKCWRCMRISHMHNPLHRIECWTGNHFRPAALWEVGVYILVKHHKAEEEICDHLCFQERALSERQRHDDDNDQKECQSLPFIGIFTKSNISRGSPSKMNIDNTFDQERISDDAIFQEMDRLHAGNENEWWEVNPVSWTITWMITIQTNSHLTTPSPRNIINQSTGISSLSALDPLTTGTSESTNFQGLRTFIEPPLIPRGNALNNKYVRIVHINGIRHLAIVFCSCLGEHLPTDLMFSGFIPVTFQINTIFNFNVLDMFRLSNLELKASAYNFFQLLDWLTSKAEVPSPKLYKDLGKVSCAWRWMKKLKWAGYGHTSANPMNPAAGELTIFCPACPQPGINLPTNLKDDPNRYYSFNFPKNTGIMRLIDGLFTVL